MKLKPLNIVVVLALMLLASSSLIAQETITLDTPIQAVAGASTLRPGDISISDYNQRIDVVYREWSDGAFVVEGRSVSCSWTVADGSVALIRDLNTANLSDKSLDKRLIELGQASPHCGIGSGTISGTPSE
jgi:hypothetical protein